MKEKTKHILSSIFVFIFCCTLALSYLATHIMSFGVSFRESLVVYGLYCIIPLVAIYITSIKHGLIASAVLILAITITVADYYDFPARNTDFEYFEKNIGDYGISNLHYRNDSFLDHAAWFRFRIESDEVKKMVNDFSLLPTDNKSLRHLNRHYSWWDIEELESPKFYESNNVEFHMKLACSDTSQICYLFLRSGN